MTDFLSPFIIINYYLTAFLKFMKGERDDLKWT